MYSRIHMQRSLERLNGCDNGRRGERDDEIRIACKLQWPAAIFFADRSRWNVFQAQSCVRR